MDFKFRYQLTQKANADLDEIVSYIAIELSNPKAASDFIDKLQDAIGKVRLFPQSGLPVVNGVLPNKEVRKEIVGNYSMYYLADFVEETIYILRIVYSRRNMDEILGQLGL